MPFHDFRQRLTQGLTLPFRDVLRGLERCLLGASGDDDAPPPPPADGYRRLLLVGLGLVAGWWIYVPLHELLHALGCLAAGGSVSELQISPLYGGRILEGRVPFVVSGGDYAGRLSGFDTHGSDLVYLVTVFAPYLLTLFPGVWALRRFGRRSQPLGFGMALPVALAPFVSLPGDAYEIGSILATLVPPWTEAAEILRGDDVVLLIAELSRYDGAPWGGLAVAAGLAVAWAFATYAAGALLAAATGQRALDPRPSQP